MSATPPTPDPTTSYGARSTATTTTLSSCIVLSRSLSNHPTSTAASPSFPCGGYGGGESQTTEKPISNPITSPRATNTSVVESPPSSPSKPGADVVVNLAAIISSIGLVVFGIGCLRLRQMRQQQRRIRESSGHLRDHTDLHPSPTSSSPHDRFSLPPPPPLPPVPPALFPSFTLPTPMQQPSSAFPPPPLPVPSHLLLYSQPRSTPQQHIEMLARLQDQYSDIPPPPYEASPPRSHPRCR